MPEVDSGLETSLRSFLNEIKAQPLPRPLAGFDAANVRPRRKGLNLFAATAGVAVIAAGVAVFAVELNGHHNTGSPTPGGQSAATPTPGATPPILPSNAAFAQVPHGEVLIPKTYGSGTKTFPTVTLGPNEAVGIDYSCVSSHSTALNSISLSGPGVPVVLGPHFQFWLSECSTPNGDSAGLGTAGGTGGRITVRFNADPSVRWVVLVYEYPARAESLPTPTASAPSYPGPTPPFLAEGPPPAGATVLIPPTYGTGPMTLPSFTTTPNENVSIELGCLSTSPSVTTVTVNEYDPAFTGDTLTGQCFGGHGGSGGGGTNGLGGTVTMKVQAAPTEKWVILVYEGGAGP
jgi:hypothetical protein